MFIFIICFLWFMFSCFAFFLGLEHGKWYVRTQAVDMDFADYNPRSGQWAWKDKDAIS